MSNCVLYFFQIVCKLFSSFVMSTSEHFDIVGEGSPSRKYSLLTRVVLVTHLGTVLLVILLYSFYLSCSCSSDDSRLWQSGNLCALGDCWAFAASSSSTGCSVCTVSSVLVFYWPLQSCAASIGKWIVFLSLDYNPWTSTLGALSMSWYDSYFRHTLREELSTSGN